MGWVVAYVAVGGALSVITVHAYATTPDRDPDPTVAAGLAVGVAFLWLPALVVVAARRLWRLR